MTRSRRGQTVAGTSARDNRKLRRARRGEQARLRRAGADTPPDVVTADQLVELARQHRDQEAHRD